MSEKCDIGTLQRVVAAHLAVYKVMEADLKRQMPECLCRHSNFQFREDLAKADFADIQGDACLIPQGQAPSFRENAEWIGYLYVVEGSTLGGRLISKRLRQLGSDLCPNGLRIFAPYGDATRRSWTAFLDVLREQTRNGLELTRSVEAARRTFCLHDDFLNLAYESDRWPS